MQNDLEREIYFKPYNLETISSLPFYTMPKILIDDIFFKDLSGDAKLLYMVMQNRVTLSQQNNWTDENGDVYIYMVLDEIQDILHCAREKAVNMMKQLKDIGLIKVKRQGQGKPNKIYINEISNYKKSNNGTSNYKKNENRTSKNSNNVFQESLNNEFPEVQKSNGINNNIINNNIINTDSSSSNARVREKENQPPLLPQLNSAYIKKYIDSIRPTASKFEIDQLTSYEEDGVSGEVIELAIEEALLNNKPNLKYIKAILDRCLDKGIKTADKFKAQQNLYKNSNKGNEVNQEAEKENNFFKKFYNPI